MGGVRRASESDLQAIVATLCGAFVDDPLASFIFPDRLHRIAALPRFFSVQLEHNYLRRGEVYVSSGVESAALWLPPGAREPTLGDRLAHLRVVPLVFGRLMAVQRLTATLFARHPRQAHFYLGTIGTDPKFQRQGFGRAVLAPVLRRCDEERIPAYVESSRAENLSFYESLGFVLTETLRIERGGPTLWLMWREPM